MRFARPEILFLLALLPLWGAGAWWSIRARRRALARFAGGEGNLGRFTPDVAANRRVLARVLVAVALASMIVALARPQWGERVETVERTGVDLVLVMDTSLSMAAQDVAPDRFRRAQLSASELLARLGGDRVGLVAFAGKASLACPLTVDHGAVRLFLDVLDLEFAPVAGTALADALETARRAFRADEDAAVAPNRSRMIVVYSDGEDHEEGLDEAVQALRRDGIRVIAVGVGTLEGGPIPMTDDDGSVLDYKRGPDGAVVTTRLDESVLERIALDTGGRYYRATAAGLEIDDVVAAVGEADAGELGSALRVRYDERFAIPCGLALVALLVELSLGDGRGRRLKGER